MELRKVQQELETLSSEWKSLRQKRPVFNDYNVSASGTSSGGTAGNENISPEAVAHGSSSLVPLALQLPSLKDLLLQFTDEDIFPPERNQDEDDNIETMTGLEGGGSTSDNGTPSLESGDVSSESGAADKSKQSESKVCEGQSLQKSDSNNVDGRESVNEEDVEEEMIIEEDASPQQLLEMMEFLRKSLLALRPKIDKFLKRLADKDPVTGKPRYGESTMVRVKSSIRLYKALELGVSIAFNDPEFSNLNSSSMQQNDTTTKAIETTPIASNANNIISTLRVQIQQHNERIQAESQAKQSLQQRESERLAQERLLAEQLAKEQQKLEEQMKRDQERQLALQAEMARQRRAEEEQRAIESEREADRQLLELVPVKGAEGVRIQINRMRDSLKDDKKALDVALGSLYTLFDQIVRKPEEVNFRRIRRDHPKFIEDIGRHVGGREVLIAAGFRLDKLEGVPSFFSKEPHIESDMDGWSNWFDGLKKTLDIIEEEMIK